MLILIHLLPVFDQKDFISTLLGLKLSQAYSVRKFGQKIAFPTFLLIWWSEIHPSKEKKIFFLYHNSDESSLRQPKIQDIILSYILKHWNKTFEDAWTKPPAFSFSEKIAWSDFQPSGRISIQVGSEVVGFPSKLK